LPKLLNESKHVGNYLKKLDGENSQSLEKLTQEVFQDLSTQNAVPVFCGHTPLRHPAIFKNHIHLDTGAGKENKEGFQRKLSIINTSTGELHQVHADFPELKIEPKDYAKKLEKALEKGDKIPVIG